MARTSEMLRLFGRKPANEALPVGQLLDIALRERAGRSSDLSDGSGDVGRARRAVEKRSGSAKLGQALRLRNWGGDHSGSRKGDERE